MKSKKAEVDLTGLSKLRNLFDDTEEVKDEEYGVRILSLDDTYDFERHIFEIHDEDGNVVEFTVEHPFEVVVDDELIELADSIKEYGILEPGICRPGKDGKYEVISGHRRKHAAIFAGIKEMPFIVRDLTDAEATIIMVDANKYRRNIKISTYAKAMYMKYYAIKHQGKRSDLIKNIEELEMQSRQGDLNELAESEGMSLRNLQRFIRLANLSEDLLQLVDKKILGITPAVALSYLSREEQDTLFSCIVQIGTVDKPYIPTLDEAKLLKRLSEESQRGLKTIDILLALSKEDKKDKPIKEKKISFSQERVRSYFPETYTQREIEEILFSLLEDWKKKNKPKDNSPIPGQQSLEDCMNM